MCKQKYRNKLIIKYRDIDKKAKEDKKTILQELDSKNWLVVDDNVVKESNLCIILSCPGEEELISGRVCAGDTGENLEKILKLLQNKFQKIIAGKNQNTEFGERYKYTIVNSINKVYFRAYNGAEAKKQDIIETNNVKRITKLLSQIDNIEYFIVCGNNAEVLCNAAQYTAHCWWWIQFTFVPNRSDNHSL